MPGGSADRGKQNLIQGDLGESWVEVVAAAAGLLHGRPYRLDLQKTDVQLACRSDERRPEATVQVQVKTTVGFAPHSDGTASYQLDVDDYEELRKRHNVSKLLAVIWLDDAADRAVITEQGTLLTGRGAWISLEGWASSPNASSVSVRLPLANEVDAEGLRRMVEEHGSPRSTQIDDVDWWSGA